MSAAKRRRKAQIARLVRMDRTYHRLYLMASPHRDGPRSWRFWLGCIVPLGDKIGPAGWSALPRCDTGEDILLNNYRRRTGK
jgi:hypothetical protein